MAKVGMAEAARLARVSRWTVARKCKAGVLSFELGNDGERRIDTAELARVFGDLHPSAPELHPVHDGAAHQVAPGAHGAGAPGEAVVLREALARLERDNERLRSDLETARLERQEAERLHREERQRLQEQIGRALLLLPAPSPMPATPGTATRRTRRPQKRRTPTATTASTRPTPAPSAAPTGLAGRVLEAVNALVGAPTPGRR